MNSENYDTLRKLWNIYGYATLRSHLDEWLDEAQSGNEKNEIN